MFGDLWSYDLGSDAWTELSPGAGPDARFGHEAVWVDGVGLVVFAGQSGATFFNDLWAYDPAAATWTELPGSGDVPVSRYGTCGAVGPDGRLWISHGFTSDGVRFSDTRAYDFDAGAWADETPEGPRPVERCLHGCWWTDDGALALYAGQTTGTLALDDYWTLADGAWSEVTAALPPGRNLYARARVDRATLVFGGQALDMSYLDDLWLLPDPAGDAVRAAARHRRPIRPRRRGDGRRPRIGPHRSSSVGETRTAASATCGRSPGRSKADETHETDGAQRAGNPAHDDNEVRRGRCAGLVHPAGAAARPRPDPRPASRGVRASRRGRAGRRHPQRTGLHSRAVARGRGRRTGASSGTCSSAGSASRRRPSPPAATSSRSRHWRSCHRMAAGASRPRSPPRRWPRRTSATSRSCSCSGRRASTLASASPPRRTSTSRARTPMRANAFQVRSRPDGPAPVPGTVFYPRMFEQLGAR